jgi:hypothetical protein
VTWLTVYREAAGWLVAAQAACLAWFGWLVRHRPRARIAAAGPEPVIDDAVRMLRRWTDEAVDAELEQMTGEGGGQDG